MSNIFSFFYNNFVKYLHRNFTNKYSYLSFGITNCIILERISSPIKDDNINKTISLERNPINHVRGYYGIKGFLFNLMEDRIAHAEEIKEHKDCCNSSEEKEIVLTDKALEKIKFEIGTYEVVLFMKGTARKPRCGFSKQALDILKTLKIDTIRTVDVLEDKELRNGLKIYSKYPNFPQLYVRGEFVGGLEKIHKMYSEGTLEKFIKE
ncbi:uncharacterized protein TOT_010001191 [Theileria orientalis strain Shintoku]|uniref:Glutaredoxin domain-containing protein n=1 Tax=Theileria orientalis strain Shintoku TaxID=869250 RepID=J4DNM8_THEOR|nr:uncharacterized protein TOT_010001191 [Theileria orientalis strain Shintoku]PVC50770.1 hypothetical protein MACL_00002056 [Theileria orientalis]BAM39234.1 uncharacterized protein TOT_010001191 [Theileria orientalis strain Shintoku]|eukprot:XP_009689535.1 uncharacterized protein TOT_010001191 [Theileria orientalis strain Shintoku]